MRGPDPARDLYTSRSMSIRARAASRGNRPTLRIPESQSHAARVVDANGAVERSVLAGVAILIQEGVRLAPEGMAQEAAASRRARGPMPVGSWPENQFAGFRLRVSLGVGLLPSLSAGIWRIALPDDAKESLRPDRRMAVPMRLALTRETVRAARWDRRSGARSRRPRDP